MSEVNGVQKGLRFDPVFNWGHVAIVFGILSSSVALYTTNEVRSSNMETRIASLETMSKDFNTQAGRVADKLTDIMVEMSAIKTKLTTYQRRTTEP